MRITCFLLYSHFPELSFNLVPRQKSDMTHDLVSVVIEKYLGRDGHNLVLEKVRPVLTVSYDNDINPACIIRCHYFQ